MLTTVIVSIHVLSEQPDLDAAKLVWAERLRLVSQFLMDTGDPDIKSLCCTCNAREATTAEVLAHLILDTEAQSHGLPPGQVVDLSEERNN